jgi:YD repeat-containing protein
MMKHKVSLGLGTLLAMAAFNGLALAQSTGGAGGAGEMGGMGPVAGMGGMDAMPGDPSAGGIEAPFDDPDSAPVLQPLSFGHVLASRHYELVLSIGELAGVGLSPGFAASIRLRSHGAAGRCGTGCDLLSARATPVGGGYELVEPGGVKRRFAPGEGGGFVELAPREGMVFEPATALLDDGELAVTEPGGRLTRHFDANGSEIARATPWGTLTLSHDAEGRLTRVENAAGAALTLAYDAADRLASATDARGFTTSLRYSFDGKLLAIEGPPDGMVPPSIHVQWGGDAIVSVGRSGLRPLWIQYEGHAATYVEDQSGDAYAFRSTATDVEVIDSSKRYTRVEYDGENVASIESGDGGLVTHVYDAYGRVIETRTATDGADLVETFAYDEDHRLVSITGADGRTSTFDYDEEGNLVVATDPFGRSTVYQHDAHGRVIAETDALGRTATTSYDANGLPLSSSFLGVTTSTTYDAFGLVATSTDAFGVVTHHTYDAHGRPIRIEREGEPAIAIDRVDLAGGGQRVTITYGDQWSTTEVDAYGRAVEKSSSAGPSVAVDYDPMTGLPTMERRDFRGASSTASMTLTNTGSPSQVWVNGQLRQSSPRIVPPGSAWFDMGAGGMMP